MDSRQRIKAILSFRKPDQMPAVGMGYWRETVDRWGQEGLPEEVLRVSDGEYVPGVDLRAYWGDDHERIVRALQMEEYLGVETWVDGSHLPIYDTVFPHFDAGIVEDLGDRVIVRSRLGVKTEELKHSTAFPRFIEFPVRNRADYEALRPRLDPETAGRCARGWDVYARKRLDQGKPVFIWMRGFFGFARDLIGLENLCLAYYDQPDLVEAMAADRCEFIKRLYTPVLDQVHVDVVRFWEDMAYNHGSMISPEIFRRFMLPYYQEITDFLHDKGVDCVAVDSDGNILDLCALFAEGRADAVYPLEIAAGSEPAALRERYPTLALLGGVDKRALAAGPEAIDRELERLAPVVERGGYLPAVDHGVPPDVSLEDYEYYLRRRLEMF
jgi:uroporphyrinogen decarboxylase